MFDGLASALDGKPAFARRNRFAQMAIAVHSGDDRWREGVEFARALPCSIRGQSAAVTIRLSGSLIARRWGS